MKNITTFLFIRNIFSLLILLFCFSINAQVGIGTTTPSESLDVIGNIEYTGALMPNNNPGNANELLLSGGLNSPSVWGPEILNISQITAFGKFYINGLYLADGVSLTLTVNDPNCLVSSNCSITWFQLDQSGPGSPPNLTDLHIISKSEAGNWVFYIKNLTGANLDTGFSILAYY